MPVSLASTLPNSSPVASRSVGFCDGVRTRCSPSAARAARGAATISERVHSARSPTVRAITGGDCTITSSQFFTQAEGPRLLEAMRALHPRWATFVLTGLLEGLRWGEIAALHVTDVDFEKGR